MIVEAPKFDPTRDNFQKQLKKLEGKINIPEHDSNDLVNTSMAILQSDIIKDKPYYVSPENTKGIKAFFQRKKADPKEIMLEMQFDALEILGTSNNPKALNFLEKLYSVEITPQNWTLKEMIYDGGSGYPADAYGDVDYERNFFSYPNAKGPLRERLSYESTTASSVYGESVDSQYTYSASYHDKKYDDAAHNVVRQAIESLRKSLETK